jgi:hypothetical protein
MALLKEMVAFSCIPSYGQRSLRASQICPPLSRTPLLATGINSNTGMPPKHLLTTTPYNPPRPPKSTPDGIAAGGEGGRGKETLPTLNATIAAQEGETGAHAGAPRSHHAQSAVPSRSLPWCASRARRRYPGCPPWRSCRIAPVNGRARGNVPYANVNLGDGTRRNGLRIPPWPIR